MDNSLYSFTRTARPCKCFRLSANPFFFVPVPKFVEYFLTKFWTVLTRLLWSLIEYPIFLYKDWYQLIYVRRYSDKHTDFRLDVHKYACLPIAGTGKLFKPWSHGLSRFCWNFSLLRSETKRKEIRFAFVSLVQWKYLLQFFASSRFFASIFRIKHKWNKISFSRKRNKSYTFLHYLPSFRFLFHISVYTSTSSSLLAKLIGERV